ncbi:MAG: glycosyltransferase [Verrucomicrobia bacterium]|nr:glycosyltransferase [Verrucomicrobiota bacterium]
MKISIIIPAYNEEKLIGGTLAKIAAACRTFDEQGCGYEVIVCDNNSTDRTARPEQWCGRRHRGLAAVHRC